MADLDPTSSSVRSRERIPAVKPLWAFWKGLLTGAAIEIPVLAAAVWVASRIGVGDPEVDLMKVLRLTAVFAGVAALLTAGGIGRLAAYAFVDGGRRRAIYRAARAHAVASAGLVLIAAIPHGHLPEQPTGWLALPAAGLISGALCGAIIGAVCSGQSSVHLSDVWSLARKPSAALKTILDPEDLVRLGSALRNRTTTLFEGIFEPAPPPPPPAPAPPAQEPTAETTAAAPGPAPAASSPSPPAADDPPGPRVDA